MHGSTRSLGFKRGSLVKHPRYGVCYVGGTDGISYISLHQIDAGKRFTQKAKPANCQFLSYGSLRWRSPSVQAG
jgi:hypothetical protein